MGIFCELNRYHKADLTQSNLSARTLRVYSRLSITVHQAGNSLKYLVSWVSNCRFPVVVSCHLKSFPSKRTVLLATVAIPNAKELSQKLFAEKFIFADLDVVHKYFLRYKILLRRIFLSQSNNILYIDLLAKFYVFLIFGSLITRNCFNIFDKKNI